MRTPRSLAGSKQVSIVVRNMTDSMPYFSRRACACGACHLCDADAPPEEVPTEQAEGMHKYRRNDMTVQERQEKLLEKLNLDGLSEWSPHNAAIVPGSFYSLIMTPLHSNLMSLGAPAPSSMRFDSMQ